MGDLEGDKQRLQRDIDDLNSKLQWLQKINSQVRVDGGWGLCGKGATWLGNVEPVIIVLIRCWQRP